jgi:hypothetical protein
LHGIVHLLVSIGSNVTFPNSLINIFQSILFPTKEKLAQFDEMISQNRQERLYVRRRKRIQERKARRKCEMEEAKRMEEAETARKGKVT